MTLVVLGLRKQPAPVETVPVVMGKIQSTVNEEGRTRVKQRYTISAPVSGQLRRIPFKAGADVVAGQTVIAVIDPVAPPMLDARTRALAEAKLAAAKAQVQKSSAALTFASSELKRFERLYSEKTVTIQDLEGAQWRETSASRELSVSEGAQRQVEAELAEFDLVEAGTGHTANPDSNPKPVEVKAPVTGKILKVIEESAKVVGSGAPLLEVGNPSDLEVVIEVLSRDGAALPPNAKVLFEQWGGPEPLQGEVRLVEPAAFTKVSALGVEEQRVNVIADLLTPPDKRPTVGSGFRVEAKIVLWEAERALKVASGALFRRGQEWAAYVLEGGKARLRKVKVGRTSGGEMQVLEGLREGESAILYPGDRIHEGLSVKTIKVEP